MSWISDLGRLRLPTRQKPGTTMPNGHKQATATHHPYLELAPGPNLGTGGHPGSGILSEDRFAGLSAYPHRVPRFEAHSPCPAKGSHHVPSSSCTCTSTHPSMLQKSNFSKSFKAAKTKKTKTSIYACIIEYEHYITYHIIQCISDPPQSRKIKDTYGHIMRLNPWVSCTDLHAAVREAPWSIPGLLQPICLGMVTLFKSLVSLCFAPFISSVLLLEIPTRRPQPSGTITSIAVAASSDLRKQICLEKVFLDPCL